MKNSFSRAIIAGSDLPESGLRRENLVLQEENLTLDTWPWTDEDEAPFKGLPPLPKVFREPILSPSPLRGKEKQEGVQPLEGSCSSLQEKITWVHGELRSMRLTDLALFNQLFTLALEIQDLKELHQEMEAFSKEELFADDQARNTNTVTHFHSAAAFELTI